MSNSTPLKRSLSLPLITLYGVGTILGAGIYVLIGEVVAVAGLFSPIAFLLAAITATFTGLSYAELSSRYPKSAGEVVYMEEGFKKPWLSTLVGYLIVLTGTVSAATIANGFVGYLKVFFPISPDWAIGILVVILCGLALLGIVESVGAATFITLLEVGGLLFIIFAAGQNIDLTQVNLPDYFPPFNWATWSGISAGAFLAFYAYIGFEDMVNVAEEVIEPKKNLPRAILLAVVISTTLYILVSVVCVLSLNIDQLSSSSAPLAALIEDNTNYSPQLISLISIFAVVNGALIQIIMASRVLYGMGQSGLTLSHFSYVSPKTKTPTKATLFISLLVLIFALWLPLVTLAKATSAITLCVFVLVNGSLILVKLKNPTQAEAKIYPMWVPIVGGLICAGLLVSQVF